MFKKKTYKTRNLKIFVLIAWLLSTFIAVYLESTIVFTGFIKPLNVQVGKYCRCFFIYRFHKYGIRIIWSTKHLKNWIFNFFTIMLCSRSLISFSLIFCRKTQKFNCTYLQVIGSYKIFRQTKTIISILLTVGYNILVILEVEICYLIPKHSIK